MEKIVRHAACCIALLVTLLTADGHVFAQAQGGLELSINRDIIDMGEQQPTCQLSCEATGNAVTLESVAIMWISLKVQGSNVHTVTKDGMQQGSFSLDGLAGNGTFQIDNNIMFIALDQLDEETCNSDQFLCEATFTGQSGVKERAFASSLPQRPQSVSSDWGSSNDTQDAARLMKSVEEMSEALGKLNMSYTSLLESRDRDWEFKAKLLSRLEALENASTIYPGEQSCDPCSIVTQALESLAERIEKLENMSVAEVDNTTETSPPVPAGPKQCERGINANYPEQFYILTDDVLGREIHCDAETDGGGWIVFQRRIDGSVDFKRTWAEFRDGFGNLSTNFWLGNEALYQLTNNHSYELRVDVTEKLGSKLYNTYSSFRIESESDNYRLRVGPWVEGTLLEQNGGGLSYHNNKPFSTKDRDNDNSNGNCALDSNTGAFWNNACSFVTPNAIYEALKWHNGIGTNVPALSLNFIEMKIRRLP